MLLVYYRLYITLALAQFLFDLELSNVWRDIRYLEPIVMECIPLPKKMHEQVRRLGTMEEVERYFPGFKAFVDATEQEIPRPKDATKRKTHYSGKRKNHTVKTQLTVNSNGLIVHKTDHARGRRHDLDIYRQRHPSLPRRQKQAQPPFCRPNTARPDRGVRLFNARLGGSVGNADEAGGFVPEPRERQHSAGWLSRESEFARKSKRLRIMRPPRWCR